MQNNSFTYRTDANALTLTTLCGGGYFLNAFLTTTI